MQKLSSFALLAALALTSPVQGQAAPVSAPKQGVMSRAKITVLATAQLFNLGKARVGEARLEQQGTHRYLHVTGAENVAGTALELLLSESVAALKVGDHSGPGTRAVRAGLLEKAEVRLELSPPLNLSNLHTVWVWCPAVKLPAARGIWTLTPTVK